MVARLFIVQIRRCPSILASSRIVESRPQSLYNLLRESTVLFPASSLFKAQQGEPGTSFHLQFLRLSNGTEPPIAYQTKLADMAPEIDASRDKDLFQWLDFNKLIATARQKIWFDINNELLACDGGTEQKPRRFLIRDDSSFRSIMETWYMDHPDSMIVEVLIIEQPGSMSYRGGRDARSAVKFDEDDNDELESE